MARQHPARRQNSTQIVDSGETLERLRQKLERYELIFRATHDVVYELNLDDATVDWNDALYTEYGYKKTEPTHTLEWWTSRVHPDDAFQLENKIIELFASGVNSWLYDYRFRRADGSYSYVHDRGLVLRGSDGKPSRLIGSLLDVTAQKELDSAKDEFISLVSHQLRTPLTVIRVYGEMLTNGMFGDLTGEQLQWVRNMTNSSAKLIDVVGDILNVSRLDLGRIHIAARLCNARELIVGCVRDVQPLADEKRVELRILPGEDLQITVDETIFTQTLHNMLTNAIRYSKPGEGVVTVSFARSNDGFVLAVGDNGIGIPKDARAHVFERFYRAKNAVRAETQGSGLGLYLIKVMADAFGGKVWFDTTAGKGTTFYMWIPERGMAPVR